MKKIVGIMLLGLLIVCLFAIKGCYIIDAGEIGVKTQFGKIIENSIEPGIHFVNPIGGSIIKYDVREQKHEMKTSVYTKDMQQADVSVVVTFTLNKSDVGIIHSSFGKRHYAEKAIYPKVIGALKDIIGNIEAVELVNAREKAANLILEKLREQISKASVAVTISSLTLTNIDYSDIFERSIEEKVIAQQNAIRAQNETVKIQEESKQTIIKAEATAKSRLVIAESEAKAVEIRGKALKENKDVVILEFINKWDGRSPTTLFLGSDINQVLDTSKFLK